jgi:Cysteine rich repeat
MTMRRRGVDRDERIKTLNKVLLLALIASSVATSAFAQQQQQMSRTDQEKACGKDVSRHCKPVIDSGDMVILSCLQQNRTKISQACQKVLKDNGV